MNAALHEKKTALDAADGLARTGLRSQHSLTYEEAWEEASALALVSIARSLESLVATLDHDEGAIRVSRETTSLVS